MYRLPFVRVPEIRRRPAPFHRTHLSMRHCVDFAMAQGTPVLAARDGIVISCVMRFRQTYDNPRYCHRVNSITILHEDGQQSYYVHLAHRSARVRRGQRVVTGQVIALSGATGYATYPHLHFGIYDANNRNIPIRWEK